MLSCSPPAHGRGISRMPGSAERVGSPAPQVTDRATENGTRCPTGPGVDSLHPCPSRRPAPHRVPSKTHNPPPPPHRHHSAGWDLPTIARSKRRERPQPALGRRLGAIAPKVGRQHDARAEAQRPQRGRACRTGTIPHPLRISSGTLHRTNHLRALRASARKPLGLPHKKDVPSPASRQRRIVHFVHFRARSG